MSIDIILFIETPVNAGVFHVKGPIMKSTVRLGGYNNGHQNSGFEEALLPVGC